MSRNDTIALDIAEKSLRILYDGHLEIAIPMKTTAQILNNRSLAVMRIESQHRKFKRDPQLYEKYLEKIKLLCDSGYIIKVDPGRHEISKSVVS